MDWLKLFGIKSATATPAPETRAITYAQGQGAGLVPERTRTGLIVNEESALGVSSVWCAVRVISEAIGSLPLVLYRKTENGGSQEARDHELWSMLHNEPNPEMTRNVFFETLMSHALLWGTAYCEIERRNDGTPIALWPIHPRYIQVLRDTVTGEYLYRCYLPPGVLHDPKDPLPVTIEQANMMVVPGLSPDGSVGYRMLQTCRNSVAYSMACDAFGQHYFGNSARLGGLIKSPNQLSDTARENLKTSFQQMYGGLENSARTAVLEEGMTYEPINYSDDGGLYTTTRQFQIAEVSRLFNISPVKLHDLARATWANLEELNTDFYTTTLRPWLGKFEAEFMRKLALNGTDFYCRFDANDILRGDIATRYTAYQTAIDAGWLDTDEVRKLENMAPRHGDEEASDTPAQNLALNGAQMASLQQIAQAVANGQLPAATAIALVMVSIPTISQAKAKAMIDPADGFEPKQAAPAPLQITDQSDDDTEADGEA
jgi:HK97 family phage portal protein